MRFAAILFAVLMATTAFAVVPPTMTYQGIFTDTEGNVFPDGVYEDVGFHIMHSVQGGPPVWSEWQDITVTNGVFEVTLGLWNPLTPADFLDPQGDGLWLSVSYDDQWMQPRQRINSVPFAFISCWADSARKAALADEATHAANSTLFDGVSLGQFLSMMDFTSFEQQDNEDLILEANVALIRNSQNFTVTRESIIYYYATVIGLSDPSICCGRGDLRVRIVNSLNQIVDESAVMSAANPGGMHAQAFSTTLSAGTYHLQIEIINSAAVTHESVEFGAFYQGN